MGISIYRNLSYKEKKVNLSAKREKFKDNIEWFKVFKEIEVDDFPGVQFDDLFQTLLNLLYTLWNSNSIYRALFENVVKKKNACKILAQVIRCMSLLRSCSRRVD